MDWFLYDNGLCNERVNRNDYCFGAVLGCGVNIIKVYGNISDVIEDNIKNVKSNMKEEHCVKSVRIRSYSGPYFPAFGLNTGKCEPE